MSTIRYSIKIAYLSLDYSVIWMRKIFLLSFNLVFHTLRQTEIFFAEIIPSKVCLQTFETSLSQNLNM